MPGRLLIWELAMQKVNVIPDLYGRPPGREDRLLRNALMLSNVQYD